VFSLLFVCSVEKSLVHCVADETVSIGPVAFLERVLVAVRTAGNAFSRVPVSSVARDCCLSHL